MTMRIFHDAPLAAGDEVAIVGDEHHYLRRVRRAKVGTTIEILDGVASKVVASIVRTADRETTAKVERTVAPVATPMLELWLGIPDSTACLEAITSAAELGCTAIVLVRTAHGTAPVPGAARIERVIRAAMRQCGRPTPPEIRGPVDLAALLDAHEHGCGVFAWERLQGDGGPTQDDLAIALRLPPRLLVGPEGGLTDDEASRCRARGMLPLGLGPWTLRTETAVAAGLGHLRARLHPTS
jgi:16S rRNA (uracil1498-N3)-methyltransferase